MPTLSKIRPRRAAAVVAAGAALSAGASGCGPSPGVSAAGAPPPKTVGVITVAQGDVARTITQPATLQGIEEAALYAKTAGYLKTISVDKGDRIRAGQVLATIESPELQHQEAQARASVRQSEAAAQGTVDAQHRAQADVTQAAAGVERARADAAQAEAEVGRARADQARTEGSLPKLQALLQGAEATVEQAQEQQAQAEAEVGRWQQQVKSAQAAQRAAQGALDKAQSDAKLQQLTFNRLKAVQDKDAGLVAAQDVDVARARMETAQSEVATARSRMEAAREEVGTAQQQLEAARRSAAAAARKVDASRSGVQAAKEDVKLHAQEVEAARQQVKVAEARKAAAQRQVGVAEGSRQSLQQQVRVAGDQIVAARRQSEGSRSALSAAGALSAYTRIVAPFDGVVTERLADPGAFVQNAGGNQASAKPIVKVVRDQQLRVMVPVPEPDVPYIRKGSPASLTLAAYPKQSFRGTVARFASAVDPRGRTMLTEIDIANPDGRLRAGMYAQVTLTLEVHHGAVSVPTEAIMGKEDDRFVYRVVNGKAEKTPVKVGVDDGKSAEITEGLRPGATVVLVGRDTIVNGAAVKTEPAKVEPGRK